MYLLVTNNPKRYQTPTALIGSFISFSDMEKYARELIYFANLKPEEKRDLGLDYYFVDRVKENQEFTTSPDHLTYDELFGERND